MDIGRCMSKDEFKALKRTGALVGQPGELVPTFSAPDSIVRRHDQMNNDRLRQTFRGIGVREPYGVAYLHTPSNPTVGPVPQSNGLNEFKFPAGTPVDLNGFRKL
jgi:hypothetical protein